jgi:hypothetical protein
MNLPGIDQISAELMHRASETSDTKKNYNLSCSFAWV